MIALLHCSTSWCQSNISINASTGEQTANKDSILISYNDLRIVNTKLIELKYEKEINDSLRSIIVNDDKIIKEYNRNLDILNKQINQAKIQRDIVAGGSIIVTLSLVALLIFK